MRGMVLPWMQVGRAPTREIALSISFRVSSAHAAAPSARQPQGAGLIVESVRVQLANNNRGDCWALVAISGGVDELKRALGLDQLAFLHSWMPFQPLRVRLPGGAGNSMSDELLWLLACQREAVEAPPEEETVTPDVASC